jgi:hypothetical protein
VPAGDFGSAPIARPDRPETFRLVLECLPCAWRARLCDLSAALLRCCLARHVLLRGLCRRWEHPVQLGGIDGPVARCALMARRIVDLDSPVALAACPSDAYMPFTP